MRSVRSAVVATFAVLFAACSSGGGAESVVTTAGTPSATGASPTPATTVTDEPATSAPQPSTSVSSTTTARNEPAALVPTDCGFAPPGLTEGTDLRCGTVEVPARSGSGSVDRFQVFVTIVGAAEPGNADPVIHLPGGPGASAEAYAPILATTYLPLASALDRQLVFIDQRGTGRSVPFLECADLGVPSACLDAWAADGIDPTAFTTANSADDVADVAAALGASQVNIWGPSYGSRLAATVAARHPDLVRSLVLESVDTMSSPLDRIAGVRGAIERIAARCSADPACAAMIGAQTDLAAEVDRAATSLAGAPIETGFGPIGSDPFVATLTGLMQSSMGQSLVPWFVHGAVTGDVPIVETVLVAASAEPAIGGPFSPAMQTLINCSDIAPFDPGAALAALQPDESAVLDSALWAEMDALYGSGCAPWSPAESPAAAEPATLDMPTLLLNGADDSNTPLANAELALASASSGTLVSFPGYGHFPLHRGGNPCAESIFLAFVDQPDVAVDSGCVDQAPALVVGLPGVTDVALKPIDLPGLGFAADLPVDWLRAGDGVFVGVGSAVSLTIVPGSPEEAITAMGQQVGEQSLAVTTVDVNGATWTRVEIDTAESGLAVAATAAGDQSLVVTVAAPAGQAADATNLLTRIVASIRPLG